MSSPKVTVGSLWQSGWELTKKSGLKLLSHGLLLSIAYALITSGVLVFFAIINPASNGMVGLSAILFAEQTGSPVLQFVSQMFHLFTGLLFAIYTIRITIWITQGKKYNVKTLLKLSGKQLITIALGYLLLCLILLFGFILFVIPGIILLFGLIFTEFLLIEGSRNAIEAIKESWKMTKGIKWILFLFSLTLVAAVLLPLIITVVLFSLGGFINQESAAIAVSIILSLLGAAAIVCTLLSAILVGLISNFAITKLYLTLKKS